MDGPTDHAGHTWVGSAAPHFGQLQPSLTRPHPRGDMTTSRAYIEGVEEDNVEQEVPLQAHLQALMDPIGESVTHADFRSAI
uniref:Uncharacterized protein n=1 Tax=Solanum tuberosum TaxID=4113 RepID=M1DAZ6_SOLTU